MEQQVESGETYVILQPVTQQIVIDPNSRSITSILMDRTLSQNYDVQSMLELFTSELPEDQYIPDIIKHRFSRIISCYILLYNGDKPSRAVLKHYSEKIVTEFPKLGPISDWYQRANIQEGYKNDTGRLVRCIDNIRYQQRQRLKQPVTQLEDPDQLKRKRKTTICTYPDSNEMITAQSLKEHLKTVKAKPEIKYLIINNMRATFCLRKMMRSQGKTIMDFITEFPHLIQYNGEMVLNEFSWMYPDYSDIDSKNRFNKCREKLLTIFSRMNQSLNLNVYNDFFKMLIAIILRLPRGLPAKKANKNVPPLVDLFEFMTMDEYQRKYVNNSISSFIRPHLIIINSIAYTEGEMFLVFDSHNRTPLPIMMSLLDAFFLLIKCYIVFNLQPPPYQIYLFNFIQTKIMHCTERRPYAKINDLADFIEKAIIYNDDDNDH
uniref:Uncharacterized protein LOC113792918 isoform X1 n=1 Tax=Dermatophagoides pteronyssinus TaxID=6956 RepID=A0A6P6Y0Q3_DERPT|nr:uncharacterized protein LOC113792918 isoform X1 [Dermatophagoides pteronyssinus]